MNKFANFLPILEKYKDERGSLIAILQEAQSMYGYIDADLICLISEVTKIKTAKIMSVASFYTQFSKQRAGRFSVLVCQGTACHVNGSKKIYEGLSKLLGISNGQTTKDELFTLQTVACIGCCSLAPAIMIEDEVFGNLTVGALEKIIEKKRAEVNK